MQVGRRASIAWWAADDLSLLALLPHGYAQLTTHCQESAATHPSETQAPGLVNLLVPGGFPRQKAQRPSLPTVPDSKRALVPTSES
jgi:hypothetical protein